MIGRLPHPGWSRERPTTTTRTLVILRSRGTRTMCRGLSGDTRASGENLGKQGMRDMEVAQPWSSVRRHCNPSIT